MTRHGAGNGRGRLRAGLLAIGLAVAPQLPAADGWSSFQNGGRLLHPAEDLPVEWTPTSGIAWTLELPGVGQSSPVVWNGIVYATCLSGPESETCQVVAVDVADGSLKWRKEFPNPTPQENSGYVSVAAPTPAVDAAGVIAFFEGGLVVALDHAGDVRWQRNLVEEQGPIVSRHGISSSVEQNADCAFVWVERQEDPYVLALDKATGEPRWKIPGVGATSWASPRLVPVGEGEHLVLSAIGSLRGLDPATGRELWALTGVQGNSTPTPVPVGNGRFLIGATSGRGEEGGGNSAASNGLVEIRRDDAGGFTADYVWRARRATSSFGSPVASATAAYFVNRVGVLYALDLETGEERYAERTADSVWATPLVTGDRILLFGKGGMTTVVADEPVFRKLGESACWPIEEAASEGPPGGPSSGPTLYGVAAVDGRLIMRGGDRLICIASPMSGNSGSE
ncbi:MAG: PQQ-binding-like beta-propeller repeat protein [Planctomyces sp.]|nr:PQQ-binding-like beta-propeller repeat protein [Planctomyces sp.]